MNVARIALAGMIVIALVAGVSMYYLQVYAYYDRISAEQAQVELTSTLTGQPEPILFDGFNAIDSDSSPIRYRACFHTELSMGTLTDTYQIYETAEPLVAPGWFSCFDAETIGADLESGTAVAFLGTENIHYGIDRIVAVYPDGRAYAWNQINECGAVVFDGDPAPEGCPPVPEGMQ